ncbi:hypothetical protein ACL02S_06855 [Nocardia sp. 004]|uniref:hypothetical protein n=1 Tax=Nocardia sp. 004 TaxID=3385978 RepID=UPI0039A3BA70
MSDTEKTGHPGRRRAVRSAGPPVGNAEVSTTEDMKIVAPSDSSARAAADDAEPAGVAGNPTAEKKTAAKTTLEKVTLEKAASGEETPEKATVEKRSRGLPRSLVLASCVLLAVVLVCGATLSVFAMRSVHLRDERRAEYVQTARQAIINLTTISADSAEEDIDRVLSLASGDFKDQYGSLADPFASVVQVAKVNATGQILETALESDDEHSAQVLVAARQSLTNAGLEGQQTRLFRFRVTVSRGDSGMTVTKVEMVP